MLVAICCICIIFKKVALGSDQCQMQVTELNNWVKYHFDCSDHINENHKKMAVLFEAGVSNTGNNIYYLDDLKLVSEIN
jgi:hypothetical protein